GGIRRSTVREGGKRRAGLRRGVERSARILIPAVSRLLGLYRDGNRERASVRRAAAGEFPASLSRDRHPRLLAPLAHLVVQFSEGLSVHSVGWQPAWCASLCAGDSGDDGTVWLVARRRLDVRGVGAVARAGPRRVPRLAAARKTAARARRLEH